MRVRRKSSETHHHNDFDLVCVVRVCMYIHFGTRKNNNFFFIFWFRLAYVARTKFSFPIFFLNVSRACAGNHAHTHAHVQITHTNTFRTLAVARPAVCATKSSESNIIKNTSTDWLLFTLFNSAMWKYKRW